VIGVRERNNVDAWADKLSVAEGLGAQVYNVVADVLTTSAISVCNSFLVLV
jgi:hypothetical protein